MHQDIHHLLLPPRIRNPTLPAIHLRPEHPNRRLGHGNLPRLCRPMSSPPRLLGQKHRRLLLRRPAIHHRQPSLQHPNRLRHPHPAHPNDLEPAPRLARQARAKRRLRSRHLRLLRQYLPHRCAFLDLSHGPHLHSVPSDIVDAYRACRRADLFEFADYSGLVPGAEIEGVPEWNGASVY